MGALKNQKHERFCLLIIKGLSNSEAYEKAGYKPHRGNALALRTNQHVSARIAELSERAEERAMISVERLAQEYARIAYSDVTDVLEFDGKKVTLKRSKDLPADVTAAISEIRQTKDGIVVKFHNKTAALDALAKHKGMFKENVDLKVTVTLADLIGQSYEPPKLPPPVEVIEDDENNQGNS